MDFYHLDIELELATQRRIDEEEQEAGTSLATTRTPELVSGAKLQF